MPFELQLYHKHPTLEYRSLGGFVNLENPVQKLENFSPVYACGKQFTSVVSKMAEIGAG